MKKPKHKYLSGPMTGIKDLNVPLFNKITKQLRQKGYLVINPAELDGDSKSGMTWESCLRRDIACIVKDCDAVALLPGWKKSRGATLEVAVARGLGLPVHGYKYYLNRKGRQ